MEQDIDARRLAQVGQIWQAELERPTAAEMHAYALATNDRNPAYQPGPAQVAPPLFAVRLFHPLLMEALLDPRLALDFLRIVHGEQQMRFLRPLRPGDAVLCRAKLEHIEQKSSGLVLRLVLSAEVDGALAVEATSVIFQRAVRKGPRPARGPRPAPPPPPPELWRTSFPVDPDQPTRYAAASRDDNPIHLSPETARKAGLPGVILHGLCTMAMCGRSLLDRAADGDPARLEALSVRFSRPVLPGHDLTLVARQGTTPDEIRFTALGPDEKPVLAQAVARFRSAS